MSRRHCVGGAFAMPIVVALDEIVHPWGDTRLGEHPRDLDIFGLIPIEQVVELELSKRVRLEDHQPAVHVLGGVQDVVVLAMHGRRPEQAAPIECAVRGIGLPVLVRLADRAQVEVVPEALEAVEEPLVGSPVTSWAIKRLGCDASLAMVFFF